MPTTIGSRLRKAREDTGLSQGAFARALNLSSEYISLLESGKRNPSFDTLGRIAAFLHKDIAYFFEEKVPALTALVERGDWAEPVRREILKFSRYCERYLRLEQETGRRLELAPLYSNISPERLADEERRRLGLGYEPIRDIFALCEVSGCRMFRLPLPAGSGVSGIFVYIEERGAAFALVNAAEPPGLQAFIAAHEYGHYLRDRLDSPIVDNPDVVVDEYVSLYPPREQFAQAFAARFLMPPSKVQEIVEKEFRGRRLEFDDVLFLKRYFGVSAPAMMRALRRQGFLTPARLDEFFKKDAAAREKEVFGDVAGQEGPPGRPSRASRPRAAASDRFRLLEAEARSEESRRRGDGAARGEAAPKEIA